MMNIKTSFYLCLKETFYEQCISAIKMGRPKKTETSLNRQICSVSFISHSQDKSVSPNKNPELPNSQDNRSTFMLKISKSPLKPYKVAQQFSPGPSKISQLHKEEENENQPKLFKYLSNISGESAPDSEKPTRISPSVSYINTCTTSIQPQIRNAALNNWTLTADSAVIGTQIEDDILSTPSSTAASASNQNLSCHGLANSSTANMSANCCNTELNPVMTSPIDQIQSITQAKDVSSSQIGTEIGNPIQIDEVIEEISGDEMDSILESLNAHEKTNVNNKDETWEPKAKKVKSEDNRLKECLPGTIDMNVTFPGIFNHTLTQKSYQVPVPTYPTSFSPPGNHQRNVTPTYNGSQCFPIFNSYHGNTETVPLQRQYMGRPDAQVSTQQESNSNFLGFDLRRYLPPSTGSLGSVCQSGINTENSLSQFTSNEPKTSTIDVRANCMKHSAFNDSIRHSEVSDMQEKEIRYEVVNELKRDTKCYFEDLQKHPKASNN